MSRSIRFAASSFLLIALVTACGPKIISTSSKAPPAISSVAILPKSFPSGITRERVDYIYGSLRNELRSSGYNILENQILEKDCTAKGCANYEGIARDHHLQAFMALDLESASRNNFLAGYYNAISGGLKLLDVSGMEILRVEHTESERGGLLFNSGQLIQGLLTTSRNQDPSAFNSLADRFTQTIVSKLPVARSQLAANTVEMPLDILLVEQKEIGDNAQQLCIKAPTSLMAYAVINRQYSNLRETSPGHYCSIFRYEDLVQAVGDISVEVRSAFGNSSRKSIKLAMSSKCNITGNIQRIVRPLGTEIRILCSVGDKSCWDVHKCKGSKLLVFKAPNSHGPYRKVGDLSKGSWVDTAKSEAIYQVVSVNIHGDYSAPIMPELVSNSSVN